jgi:repressor LexA
MKGLTKRQKEIVSYIEEFIQTHRYSPSYREIMQHFDFSSLGTVYRHINVLKRKGMLFAEKNCSRSIALTALSPEPESQQSDIKLPFIGHLTAGKPIETFPQSQTIGVPVEMVHAPDRSYVLRVLGDAFAEERICEGDLLIVEARHEAHAGETVVALVNQHDTIIKRYSFDGEYVRLTSRTQHQHPIVLHPDEIQIQGVLVGLLRVYG